MFVLPIDVIWKAITEHIHDILVVAVICSKYTHTHMHTSKTSKEKW